ncbi:MAG: 4-hydroxy-3-methylbut-2-enyl diphosphate reductase, partial [Dehalococcoidia bacterium]|nr:4-hydroxy-3-methylbut-2-enyl diphosphate reductase [Dehalococcoidia bacterium]
VEEEVKRRGRRVVDATCPIVKKVHLVARDLAQAGYDIVIFGDPGHQEVQGIAGWAGPRVVATPDWPPASGHGLTLRRIAVLSQTTKGEEEYRRFIAKLMDSALGRAREVRVINTICGVTDAQKSAAREMSRIVDLVLVVGGRTSANTRGLAEVCARAGVETHQIETAGEIDQTWLAAKSRVGVTAGASTPDWIIEEVVAYLEAAGGMVDEL